MLSSSTTLPRKVTPSAAAKFSKEANLRPTQEEESVKARQKIQHFVHLGHIQEAIEALNELEPQVSGAISFLSPLHFAMIRHEFMHHSYSLRVDDEKNYQTTSVLSMSKIKLQIH